MRWMEEFISCSKNLQNRLYSGTLKHSIFLRKLCGKPILIFFHKWDFSQVCGKQRLFILLYSRNFYSPRSYMIKVSKINCGLLHIQVTWRRELSSALCSPHCSWSPFSWSHACVSVVPRRGRARRLREWTTSRWVNHALRMLKGK